MKITDFKNFMRTAYCDVASTYNSAKNFLSSTKFSDLVKAYPLIIALTIGACAKKPENKITLKGIVDRKPLYAPESFITDSKYLFSVNSNYGKRVISVDDYQGDVENPVLKEKIAVLLDEGDSVEIKNLPKQNLEKDVIDVLANQVYINKRPAKF
jgi:hypothetical protein